MLKDPTHTTTLASEKYLNISVDPTSSRYIVTTLVQNSNLALVQTDISGNPEVPGSRPADTISFTGSPSQPTPTPVFGQNGDDGGELTFDEFIGPGTAANKLGLYALENTDLFNILCIPPYTGDDVDVTVVTAAATYCKGRRAFYIVDPPSNWTNLQTALTQFSAQNFGITTDTSDYAAMYFPRVLEPNPLLDNQLDTFVPCGIMAGIYVAHRRPARRLEGSGRAGERAERCVAACRAALPTRKTASSIRLGLNCLRSFPIVGRVCWGARTLQGADALESEWKYVPVRRTGALHRGEPVPRHASGWSSNRTTSRCGRRSG